MQTSIAEKGVDDNVMMVKTSARLIRLPLLFHSHTSNSALYQGSQPAARKMWHFLLLCQHARPFMQVGVKMALVCT